MQRVRCAAPETVVGHRPTHRPLTRHIIAHLLFQDAVNTKAAGIGIFQLGAEHFVHKGECQLVIRMIGRPGALVLQTGEVIFLKRLDESHHVLA